MAQCKVVTGVVPVPGAAITMYIVVVLLLPNIE